MSLITICYDKHKTYWHKNEQIPIFTGCITIKDDKRSKKKGKKRNKRCLSWDQIKPFFSHKWRIIKKITHKKSLLPKRLPSNIWDLF